MTIRKICASQVFRSIGAGHLDVADVKGDNVILCYSPATVLELASRYTNHPFEYRKAAARAILDTGAELLPDPETYLTHDVFALSLHEREFDWARAVDAMAQSPSMELLLESVADYQAAVRRRVNLAIIKSYREGVDRQFVEDMITLQSREIKGFSEWWNPDPAQYSGYQVPCLSGPDRDDFLEQMETHQFDAALIQACQDRALFKTNDQTPWPSATQRVEVLADACGVLAFYVACFTQYLARLLTAGMLPRENDGWDLELMMYSCDDDHIVVTSDAKWESIACTAGFPQRLNRIGRHVAAL